jgi:hypothetical protein
MKVINSLTPEQFQQFQEENMDPALSVIGISLSKFEKRKQVAARLLGFNSFESIDFNKNDYLQKPDVGEMYVARHPWVNGIVVFLTRGAAVCVHEKCGKISFIDGQNLSIADISKQDIESADTYKRDLPFEPLKLDLGFSGIKAYNISFYRLDRLRLEFDWILSNGIVDQFIIKTSTTFTEKPTSKRISAKVEIATSTTSSKHSQGDIFFCLKFHCAGENIIGNVTDEMILWELEKTRSNKSWQDIEHPTAESLECIKIAYAFLDAQKTTKNKRSFDGSLKACIEKWGGRYVSIADVNMAIKMHPDLHGDAKSCNISKNLIMPCMQRLQGIKEANTQEYRFEKRDHHLDQFKWIEKEHELEPFKKDSFLNSQETVKPLN